MAILHPSQFAAKHAIYAGFKEFDRLYPKGVEATTESLGKLSLMALEWLFRRLAAPSSVGLESEYETEVRLIHAGSRKRLAESYLLFREESKTVGDDEARNLLSARDLKTDENTKLFLGWALSNYKDNIIASILRHFDAQMISDES